MAQQKFSYYCPQTKFAKVMFSQVSVCPQGGLDLCPGGSRSGGSLSRGGLYAGGSVCRGVSGQGRSLSGGSLVMETPPRTVTSGRYASYWNAFLFKKYKIKLLVR